MFGRVLRRRAVEADVMDAEVTVVIISGVWKVETD